MPAFTRHDGLRRFRGVGAEVVLFPGEHVFLMPQQNGQAMPRCNMVLMPRSMRADARSCQPFALPPSSLAPGATPLAAFAMPSSQETAAARMLF